MSLSYKIVEGHVLLVAMGQQRNKKCHSCMGRWIVIDHAVLMSSPYGLDEPPCTLEYFILG